MTTPPSAWALGWAVLGALTAGLLAAVLSAALPPWDVTAGQEVLVDPTVPALPGRPVLAAVTTPGGGTAWRVDALDAAALGGLAIVGRSSRSGKGGRRRDGGRWGAAGLTSAVWAPRGAG